MPLYRIVFQEHGGYHVACRIRAAAVADHLTLAVKKIWGDQAVWVPQPGPGEDGRVFVSVGNEEDDLMPRTAVTTVQITPGASTRTGIVRRDMAKWLIEVTIKVRTSLDAGFRHDAVTIAQAMGQAVVQNPALEIHCLTVETVVQEDD